MRLVQRVARNARAQSHDAFDDISAAPSLSRRTFVKQTLAIAGAGAMPFGAWPVPARAASAAKVVIVGAGLAGLAAAYELRKAGVAAELYEASPRAGGRCWSERRAFESQIAERGGELIDTAHEEIRALVAELGLELDDLLEAEAKGSEPAFVFGDIRYSLDAATADFQRVLPALDIDAKALGDDLPTYRRATAAQRALDRMSADRWIATRVAGGLASPLGRLLANAYIEELGGDLYEISAVSVVALLRASPRDRFSPYEESDQRYHVRGGNDQIVRLLATRLDDRIAASQRLLAIARRGDGRCRLTFARDQSTHEQVADRVVLALPFTLLRQVDLSAAAFSPRKLKAIRELGMGRNTKLQLQFTERAWERRNANGETRVDGAFQTSWEATRAQQGPAGILNFYSGGSTATRAGEGEPDERAREALADLDRALPGLSPLWNGRVIRNAWERYPWTLGSYSLLKPGQYTTLNGAFHEREGNVHFAGEHTSESWSGYLNGAVESGQRAAREVLAALRIGVQPPRRRAAELPDRASA
jgi:monoamine oxidase